MSKLTVTPTAPSFGFLPTAAVGSTTAAAYLYSVGAPKTHTATVLVVSVTILALAALGKKGLTGIALTTVVVIAVASFVGLDPRIPTAGDVASGIDTPTIGLPDLPDISVGRPAPTPEVTMPPIDTTNPTEPTGSVPLAGAEATNP